MLLYIFLQRLKCTNIQSFLLALIFAVHPVFVNSVAWLPGRNDTFLAIFVLSSFIFLIDFARLHKFKYFILHILSFAAALFSKETGLACLILYSLYLFLFYKKFFYKNVYLFCFSWIMVCAAWYFIRDSVISGSGAGDYFKNQLYYLQAIGKIFLPVNLTVLPTIIDTVFLYGIISSVILAVLFYFTEDRNYKLFFLGVAWFITFLFLPLININPEYSQDLMLESRLYLPAAGIFIAISQTDLVKKLSFKNKYLIVFYCIVILTFGYINIKYADNYKDEYSFWQDAVDNSPLLDLSFAGLGLINFQKENYVLAAINYQKASELNPGKIDINKKTATSLLKLDRVDEAEIYYRKELQLNPDDYESNLLVGIISYKKNNFEEAVKYLETAGRVDSSDIQPLVYLMKTYHKIKRFDEAKRYADILISKNVKIPEEILKDIK